MVVNENQMFSGYKTGTQAWYRGNLHCHTTNSDGLKTPSEAVNWYHKQGYDFLAITDHDVVTVTDSLDDFLVIRGIELDTSVRLNNPSLLYHVVGIGIKGDIPQMSTDNPQQLIDAILRAEGIAFIAHPRWSGNVINKEFLDLTGYIGLECYNSTCMVGNNTGLATTYWDSLLSYGMDVFGLATDDTHWTRPDAGKAWVMVQAPALTNEDILLSLKMGQFYSSTGPEIYRLEIIDGQVIVECSPAKAIHFMCNGPKSKSVRAASDELITSAQYPLTPGVKFVRAEIVDERGDVAWSNPLVLKKGIGVFEWDWAK